MFQSPESVKQRKSLRDFDLGQLSSQSSTKGELQKAIQKLMTDLGSEVHTGEELGIPDINASIEIGEASSIEHKTSSANILDPKKIGLDCPEVDLEHLLNFKRNNCDRRSAKQKMEHRKEVVRERVTALCTYMALKYAHQQTQGRLPRDFKTKESRDALVEGKSGWAKKIILGNPTVKEGIKAEEEKEEELKCRVTSRNDLSQERQVIEQLAKTDLKKILAKFTKAHSLAKLLQQLEASYPLQSLYKETTSTQTMVKVRKLARKINDKIWRDLPSLEKSTKLINLKLAVAISIQLAGITKDVLFLVEFCSNLQTLGESQESEDWSATNLFLCEQFSMHPHILDKYSLPADGGDKLPDQEKAIYNILKTKSSNILAEKTKVLAENALKSEFGFRALSTPTETALSILEGSSVEWVTQIKEQVKQVKVHHWLGMVSRVIATQSKEEMKELQNSEMSKIKLFLDAPFCLTQTSELFDCISKCIESLKVSYNEQKSGLSEDEVPTFAAQMGSIAMTLDALLYVNLAADLHNRVNPWRDQDEGRKFGEWVTSQQANQLVQDVDLEDKLAQEYGLDQILLTQFALSFASSAKMPNVEDKWVLASEAKSSEHIQMISTVPLESRPQSEASIDLGDCDLSNPINVTGLLYAMGFLEESPPLLHGSLLKLLQKFRDHEQQKTCQKGLHLSVIALFSRDELLYSGQLIQVVLEILTAREADLDVAVKTDLVRFVIIGRVCKLLEPVKDSDVEQPYHDSPEALIMQSDLLSGGLEPHLFCLFKDCDLKSMLTDAWAAGDHNSEIVQLLKEALQGRDKNLKEEILTEQDKLLRQTLGEDCQNEQIDMMIKGLQCYMRGKPNLVAGSRVGGTNGEKLTRQAFAVMVKFAGLTDTLEHIITELDYAQITLPEEEGVARDRAVLEAMQGVTGFEDVLRYWIIASKMRSWLNGKRQSIFSRLITDNQTEEEQKEATEKGEAQIREIIDKISAKASFLLSLSNPASFEQTKEDKSIEKEAITLLRKPSYAQELGPNPSNLDQEWQEKITQWRSDLQELGIFKHRNETLQQIRAAGTTSVLACLQSPIHIDQIIHQVRNQSWNAIRRLSALQLLETLAQSTRQGEQSGDLGIAQLIIDAFTVLQGGGEKKPIVHYTEGIKGCGLMLEEKVQETVFRLLSLVTQRVPLCQKREEKLTFLSALEWRFSARDFALLVDKIQIFPALSSKSEEVDDEESLVKEKRTLFKKIFFSVAARICEGEKVSTMKIKKSGETKIPEISRRKSILSESAAETLLAQAYYEIFRQLNTIVEFHSSVVKYAPLLVEKKFTVNQTKEIAEFLRTGDLTSEANAATKEAVEEFLTGFDSRYEQDATVDQLEDLLSMLQLHVNVSLASALPQQMLLSLASPYHIGILLQLLVILPPESKLKIIKILDGLRQNKLPRQLFDDAVKPLLGEDRKDLLFLEHLKSDFSKFLFTAAAKIRSFEGLNKKLGRVQPYHSVSRQYLCLSLAFADPEKVSQALTLATKDLSMVRLAEQSLLFEMLDSAITYASLGDRVVYTERAFFSKNLVFDNECKEITKIYVAEEKDKLDIYSQTDQKCYKDEQIEELVLTPTFGRNGDLVPTPELVSQLVATLKQPCDGFTTELTKIQVLKFLLREKKALPMLTKAETISLSDYVSELATKENVDESQLKELEFLNLKQEGRMSMLEHHLQSYIYLCQDRFREMPPLPQAQESKPEEEKKSEESDPVQPSAEEAPKNTSEDAEKMSEELKTKESGGKRSLVKNYFLLCKAKKEFKAKRDSLGNKIETWVPDKYEDLIRILKFAMAWYALSEPASTEYVLSQTATLLRSVLAIKKDNRVKKSNYLSLVLLDAVWHLVAKRDLSEADIERTLKEADYGPFFEAYLKIDQTVEGATDLIPPLHDKVKRSLVFEKYLRRLVIHSTVQKSLAKKAIDEKKIKDKLCTISDILSRLLLRKLAGRLYFELQQSQHLDDQAIDESNLKTLIRIAEEHRQTKIQHRQLAPWMCYPKGFDGAVMLSIWKRFAKTNPQEKFCALALRQIKELLLSLKLREFSSPPQLDEFIQKMAQIQTILSLSSLLSASDLAKTVAVELADCLLACLTLDPRNHIRSIDQNYLAKQHQKTLAALTALVSELAERGLVEEIRSIWRLKPLQALFGCLPNDIGDIILITEYKLSEIYLKIQPFLGREDEVKEDAPIAKFSKSLQWFKKSITDTLTVQKDALLEAQKTAEQQIQEISIEAASGLGQWQKVDLNGCEGHKTFKITIAETDDSVVDGKFDTTLCTYAAISKTPEITESTKLVRFTHSERSCELELPVRNHKSLYLQYPVDKNYILQVKTIAEKHRLKILDKHLVDPTFEVTSLEAGVHYRNEFGVNACNRESKQFYFLEFKNEQKSFFKKPKQTFLLPKSEKVKQLSCLAELRLNQFHYKLDKRQSGEAQMIVTQSGRLFFQNTQTENQPAEEIRLEELGYGPAECISEAAFGGTRDGKLVGTKTGEILLLKECQIECVSKHKLWDGSTIAKVHEIAETAPDQINRIVYVCRVTTSNGDNVVVSATQFEVHKEQVGRTCARANHALRLDLLDYEHEQIQFSQLTSSLNLVAALDQYGEIWFLAGQFDGNKNSGIDYKGQHSTKKLNRPICSNLMRKAGKIALQIFLALKSIIVKVRDIVTQKEGLMFFRSQDRDQAQSQDQVDEQMKFVNSTIASGQQKFDVVDFKAANQKNYEIFLFVLCKAKLADLKSRISVKIHPVHDPLPQPGPSTTTEEDRLRLKTVTDAMAELCKNKETVEELLKNAKKKNYLLHCFSKKLHASLGEDSVLKDLATRFLRQQEALFRGLKLISMTYEDLCSGPQQIILLADYKQAIVNSRCGILHRILIRLMMQMKSTASSSMKNVNMNRLDAQEFKLKQRHETIEECSTLFTQLLFGYKENFNMLDIREKQPFETHFAMELSYDCGGPMRDTLQFICDELMSDVLPLFRPTANNQSNLEPETECYQLNEKTRETFNLRKLRFLGYLLGWSLITIGSLNLELPKAFWSRICGGRSYVYTLDDLKSQDILLAKFLRNILEAASESSESEFAEVYGEQAFVLENGARDGGLVALCEAGQSKMLTKDNAEEFVRLYLAAYTKLDSLQFDQLYMGLEDVGTRKIMNLLSPAIAKKRICADSKISLAAFKASTTVSTSELEENGEKYEKMFWQMVEEMKNEDRQLLLKFMCGRSRLEPGTQQQIDFQQSGEGGENASLPIGHTCGNSMDLIAYDTLEIMTKKVLIAIRLCGEIDDDASYLNSEFGDEGLATAQINMQEQSMGNSGLRYVATDYKAYPLVDYLMEADSQNVGVLVDQKGQKVEEDPNEGKENTREELTAEAAEANFDF